VLDATGIVPWMATRMQDGCRQADVIHDLPSLRRTMLLLAGQGWQDHDDADTLRHEPAMRLTAGVDVQKDRIEVDVWAWGRGLESWLIDHIVIPGGPDDPACWDRLTALLGQTWTHQNGAIMTLAKLAIDTGYESAAVYAWSRKQGIAQVAPVKGVEGSIAPRQCLGQPSSMPL
jgi:hypothetical protein